MHALLLWLVLRVEKLILVGRVLIKHDHKIFLYNFKSKCRILITRSERYIGTILNWINQTSLKASKLRLFETMTESSSTRLTGMKYRATSVTLHLIFLIEWSFCSGTKPITHMPLLVCASARIQPYLSMAILILYFSIWKPLLMRLHKKNMMDIWCGFEGQQGEDEGLLNESADNHLIKRATLPW